MNSKSLQQSYALPPDGQGIALFTSPTVGTLVHVTPGGWDILRKISKWLLATGGWVLYMVSRWIEHGL